MRSRVTHRTLWSVPPLFRLTIDEDTLTDELFAFVMDYVIAVLGGGADRDVHYVT